MYLVSFNNTISELNNQKLDFSQFENNIFMKSDANAAYIQGL